MSKLLWPLVYLASIVLANWSIVTFGLVPVGLGLLAPAGVYFVGLTFLARDGLQEQHGRRWAFILIVLGAALSALVSNPALALASGVTFLVSETADMLVYTPLRNRNRIAAITLSNIAGLTIDSILFLWLAFGSLQFLAGQIVGKAWVTLIAVAILYAVRYVKRQRVIEA